MRLATRWPSGSREARAAAADRWGTPTAHTNALGPVVGAARGPVPPDGRGAAVGDPGGRRTEPCRPAASTGSSRVAWTLADLAGRDRPGEAELAEAIALHGTPVPGDTTGEVR